MPCRPGCTPSWWTMWVQEWVMIRLYQNVHRQYFRIALSFTRMWRADCCHSSCMIKILRFVSSSLSRVYVSRFPLCWWIVCYLRGNADEFCMILIWVVWGVTNPSSHIMRKLRLSAQIFSLAVSLKGKRCCKNFYRWQNSGSWIKWSNMNN